MYVCVSTTSTITLTLPASCKDKDGPSKGGLLNNRVLS